MVDSASKFTLQQATTQIPSKLQVISQKSSSGEKLDQIVVFLDGNPIGEIMTSSKVRMVKILKMPPKENLFLRNLRAKEQKKARLWMIKKQKCVCFGTIDFVRMVYKIIICITHIMDNHMLSSI